MKIEVVFLGTVALLEAGAVIVYLLSGRPRMAFIWACYAAATVALVGVKR